MKKVGILRFLGTNCDRDVWQAVENVGLTPEWLWYQNQFDQSAYSAFIVPGGFSYGDYLRCGALAAKAPVMGSLREAAAKGKPVLGICNGFQILCESGLLPGVLVRNKGRRFIDKWTTLNLVNPSSYWSADHLQTANLPIAHGEGCFFIPEQEQKKLADNKQIWWTYGENPNGSVMDIAGVLNSSGNVAALMPHPERAICEWMGSVDGKSFFETLR